MVLMLHCLWNNDKRKVCTHTIHMTFFKKDLWLAESLDEKLTDIERPTKLNMSRTSANQCRLKLRKNVWRKMTVGLG